MYTRRSRAIIWTWDFGNESLMQRHAKVEGDALRVGRMSYKVLVVPPSYTIRHISCPTLTRKLMAPSRKKPGNP